MNASQQCGNEQICKNLQICFLQAGGGYSNGWDSNTQQDDYYSPRYNDDYLNSQLDYSRFQSSNAIDDEEFDVPLPKNEPKKFNKRCGVEFKPLCNFLDVQHPQDLVCLTKSLQIVVYYYTAVLLSGTKFSIPYHCIFCTSVGRFVHTWCTLRPKEQVNIILSLSYYVRVYRNFIASVFPQLYLVY